MRTSIVGTTAGAGLGAGYGFLKVKDTPAVTVDAKVQRLVSPAVLLFMDEGKEEIEVGQCSYQAHSPSQVRADDYSLIGATLAALLVPTVFLKRAPFIALVLGGAGIGLGAGTAFHIAKEYNEGKDARPTGMVSCSAYSDQLG
jgi:hypothetical protein